MAIFSIKPANMKTTPYGTLTVVALVGLSLAAVLTFSATAQSPTSTLSGDELILTIKTPPGRYHSLKKNDCAGETDFIKLLNNGHYLKKTEKLHFKSGIGKQEECDLPGVCAPCTESPSPAQLNIKTDKVTVANAAQRVAEGDPNVTIKIASVSPADIEAVLALLQ